MRKFFALLIWLVFFFPLAVSAMAMTSIRPWILDRAFYERIGNDDRIYDGLFTGELPNQLNRQILAADQLPQSALNSALRQVMTPDYLRAQSAYLVNQTFDFIEGRSGTFDVSVDLMPVKAALRGEAGLRFANTLAAALPFCDTDQKSVVTAGHLPRCMDPRQSIAATAAQIVHALPAIIENMPERLLLSNTLDLSHDLRSVDLFLGVTVRSGLDMAIVMVILVTVLVGVIIAYVRNSDLRINVRWLSASLLIPASMFLLVGLALANPFIAGPIRNAFHYSQWTTVQTSDAFRQALADMSILIIQRVGNGFLLTGSLTVVLAFVLIIASWPNNAAERPAVKMVQVRRHS